MLILPDLEELLIATENYQI